ncbi:MAG TPA: hypothetical protein VGK05_03650 [Acidimicrobiia bacterium]
MLLVACGGNGGGSTKAFCDSVRELRKLGRDPGSTEPADPQLLETTIAGLRDLERSAPSDLKGDVETIRDTLETIASLGEGKRVDPKKIEKLAENDEKIREAGKNIDRQVEKCGIKVPST